MNIYEELESNVRSYCRSFPVTFTKAKMSKMYTDDGRVYIDFFNGAGALDYGHNNDYIKAEIIKYIESDGISHALDLHTDAKARFLTLYRDMILKPRGLDYKVMFCGPTGTNAVEAALKLSRKVTKRTGIFALTGSFHGMTQGSLSVTSGKTPRAGAGRELTGTTFVPHPYLHPEINTLAYMEELMCDEYSGVEKPAAVIIETVQAEGGVIILSNEFLRGLRELCTRQGVMLIVDDIQVGCGRTGKFFSFERAGIVPDFVVQSKSISGYGLPMSLLLIKPEYDIFAPAEHNGTFRGNQMAFVGAAAALEYREKHALESKTVENEETIRKFALTRILTLHEDIQYRGMGMIHGLDFGAMKIEDAAGKVARECFKNGLIIERAGRGDCVLKIMPALTIEKDELIKGLEIIEKAVKTMLSAK
jgi:diaminobutyrate-2-oxoglutarate transaminase